MTRRRRTVEIVETVCDGCEKVLSAAYRDEDGRDLCRACAMQETAERQGRDTPGDFGIWKPEAIRREVIAASDICDCAPRNDPAKRLICDVCRTEPLCDACALISVEPSDLTGERVVACFSCATEITDV